LKPRRRVAIFSSCTYHLENDMAIASFRNFFTIHINAQDSC